MFALAVLLSVGMAVHAKSMDCASLIDDYNWKVDHWEMNANLLSEAWDQLVADYNNGASPEQVNLDTQEYNFRYGLTTSWANLAADAYAAAHEQQCM